MEDEPKHSRSADMNGNGNGNDSDTSVREQQAARLLQVTMATLDTEGKEEIEGNINGGFADADADADANAVGTFPGAGSASTEDEYILQPPNAATGDKSLAMQIERDLEHLSERERQQVYYDMRGEVFKAEPRNASSSAAADSMSLMMNDIYHQASDSSVSETEIESLNRELFRLLEDPQEQQKNPVYKEIVKILSSSGSDFYANSIGFRTKLLRAELNDVRKAAKRTAGYLALLWESFGKKSLSRPIRLSDLSPAERQLQRKGYQQLFRFRDQSPYSRQAQEQEQKQSSDQLQNLDTGAGRRIAGSFDLCRCIRTTEPAIDDAHAKTRVLLYLMQVASDDEETQTQGIVFIFMLALRAVLNALSPPCCPPVTSSIPIPDSKPSATQTSNGTPSLPRKDSNKNMFGNDSTSDSDNDIDDQLLDQLQFSPHQKSHRHNHTLTRIRVLSKLFRCGLVRVSAVHVCSPSRPELQQLKFDFLKVLDRHERVRTRFHNGTSMECSLSLNKVGIPTDRLPLKYDGTIKTEDHLQWIAIQEAKELAAKLKRPFNIVECPMNMDILSGRGQLVRSHPGNVSFRKDFIRERSPRYDMAANREEKNSIADDILEDISIMKRRFLKQHPGAGYWTELDKKTSKEKVMMAFREFRKSQRNQEQQQQIRTAQRQQHLQQPTTQQLARPSLPLSRSLSHSPVTHLSVQQRQSQSSLTLSTSQKSLHGHHDEAVQSQQPHHMEQQHQQGDLHYQIYPPPSSSAAGPSIESFHHPQQHHIPVAPPPLPYYLPHPPIPPHQYQLRYGHPIPPHLLHPSQHHLSYPPHLLCTQADSGNNPPSDAAGSDRPEAAAAAVTMGYMGGPSSSTSQVPLAPHNPHMGYHHPMYHPPIMSDLGHRGGEDDDHRRSRGSNDEGDGESNERRYKRYRTI